MGEREREATTTHDCRIHCQCCDAAGLLQSRHVQPVGQPLTEGRRREDAGVARVELLPVLVRGSNIAELLTHVVGVGRAHAQLAERPKAAAGVVGVLLVQPAGRLGVPEGHDDEHDADGDLDHVGHAPGDVVWPRVKGHAVASPEGNERAELVAELGDSADERAAQHPGGTFGHLGAVSR